MSSSERLVDLKCSAPIRSDGVAQRLVSVCPVNPGFHLTGDDARSGLLGGAERERAISL